MKKWFVALLLFSTTAFAADQSLEGNLKTLDLSDTATPKSIANEKFYAIQSRNYPLKYRTEVGIGYGYNLSGNSFLRSDQLTFAVQFHFNDSWSLAIARSQVYNEFSSTADNMVNESGVLPEVAFLKSRNEIRAEYNLFYGKFRFTKDQALYFDQYLGLGAAQNELNTGTKTGPVADAGFVFWIGKRASLRAGLKDYYYEETTSRGSESKHNIHAYALGSYIF
jgi:outer membrane immunogenic protein